MQSESYDGRDMARMFEQFWAFTEHELVKVDGMSVLILSRTMAEIQSQSFGALAAYDVTLSVHRTQQDDSPLCGALYRNLYGTARKTQEVNSFFHSFFLCSVLRGPRIIIIIIVFIYLL